MTKAMDTKPGALDRQGAAEYLAVSTRTLDDLLSRGDLKRLKIGRKTVVRVRDLDAYLDRLELQNDQ